MTDEYFMNSRGQKLRHWSLPAKEDDIAAMIFIHGVCDSISAYEEMAKSLQEKFNIRVCGFDLVGHGLSDGKRVYVSKFDHYVDDVFDFIKYCKESVGQLPLFIMGHSMGGLILGHVLLRDDSFCKGAIMYAPAVSVDPRVATPFKVAAAKVLSSLIPSFPVGSIDEKILCRDEAEVEKMIEDPLRYHGSATARWSCCMLKAIDLFGEKLDQIKAPMLILHGDDDRVCPIEGSRKLYQECSSSDKNINVFEGCYHRLHVEPDGASERFITDVGEWISQRCH